MTVLALAWFCAVCALEHDEPFCGCCGKQLRTPADLTPHTSQEPQGVPFQEAPSGSQTKGQ